MNKLLLLSTQRSGSTMVCEDIASAGVLGRPSEYFSGLADNFAKFESVDELSDAFEASLIKGFVEKTNSCSVKIMQSQIGAIGKILIDTDRVRSLSHKSAFVEFFREYHWARIIRGDKVAQAVSRVVARHTDVYHRVSEDSSVKDLLGKFSTKEREDSHLVYDETEIRLEIQKIKHEEQFLDDLIGEHDVNVFNIIYEEVVEDRSYINRLVKNVTGEKSRVKLQPRSLKKVSGSLSEDWIERYKKNNE